MTTTATLRTTGTLDGVRIYHERTFQGITLVELDFIPATDSRPTQARIWHQVWDRQLRRFDRHVALVVQDDAGVNDLIAAGVETA